MGDKTLFRGLSENGNPTLSTVHKVLRAVGNLSYRITLDLLIEGRESLFC